jgi:chromatin structure-remodeling complex subunit RSC1/2
MAHQHRGPAQAPPVTYKAPSPVEVWHLPDAANASIPADIRAQFQTDAQGRVLFFTAPPVAPSEAEEKRKLAHSPSYLAFRARQMRERAERAEKRLAEEEVAATVGAEQSGTQPKRARTEDLSSVGELGDKAISFINSMLADTTISQLKMLYGDQWEKAVNVQMRIVTEAQQKVGTKLREQESEGAEKSKQAAETAKIHGLTGLFDYRPPNETLEWRR